MTQERNGYEHYCTCGGRLFSFPFWFLNELNQPIRKHFYKCYNCGYDERDSYREAGLQIIDNPHAPK